MIDSFLPDSSETETAGFGNEVWYWVTAGVVIDFTVAETKVLSSFDIADSKIRDLELPVWETCELAVDNWEPFVSEYGIWVVLDSECWVSEVSGLIVVDVKVGTFVVNDSLIDTSEVVPVVALLVETDISGVTVPVISPLLSDEALKVNDLELSSPTIDVSVIVVSVVSKTVVVNTNDGDPATIDSVTMDLVEIVSAVSFLLVGSHGDALAANDLELRTLVTGVSLTIVLVAIDSAVVDTNDEDPVIIDSLLVDTDDGDPMTVDPVAVELVGITLVVSPSLRNFGNGTL